MIQMLQVFIHILLSSQLNHMSGNPLFTTQIYEFIYQKKISKHLELDPSDISVCGERLPSIKSAQLAALETAVLIAACECYYFWFQFFAKWRSVCQRAATLNQKYPHLPSFHSFPFFSFSCRFLCALSLFISSSSLITSELICNDICERKVNRMWTMLSKAKHRHKDNGGQSW